MNQPPLLPSYTGEGRTRTLPFLGRFTISPDHPSLPGHFPGRPVVPGVVLLSEVLACLPDGATLLTAKFTAPVLPGTGVDVQAGPDANGRIVFACFAAGCPVLHGTATA